jgi:endonuclease/exonuclease/phosphatase family metal-dependent hydrolase
VGLLLRTWNLFHGNSVPPERRDRLERMVRLVTADEPDVVLLQELPAWALPRLGAWSGMQAVGDVAARPHLGPLPSTAELGRLLTGIHHGALRSTFSGQANAILVAPRLRVLARERIVLNAKRFRDAQARVLRLGALARLAWAKERRVAQAVRLRLEDGATLVVANLHATSFVDPRLADAELIRAGTWVEALAAPDEPVVLAGDLNVRAASSRALPELAAWGFRHAGGSVVDHVLVRGLETGPVVRWADGRRTLDGRLLSDHAPLEVTIE